jgi:CubicO group peptidase (beta-lactamase class C family)
VISRRHVLAIAGLAAAAAMAMIASAPVATQNVESPWPGREWAEAPAGALGDAAARFATLDGELRDGVYGHADRVLVVHRGRAVANWTYRRDYRTISRGRTTPIGCGEGCTDKAWMHEFNYLHPDWHPYFQGRAVHTLQSVTKSIAATVVGIAIGRGDVAAVDRPFLTWFKDRDLSGVDPRLQRATLDDLLTMRSGIEWHEQDRPLDDTNTTLQLERSRDWIAFTLKQPMDAAPGEKWAYNSGGSHLMAGIVRGATGRAMDDYTREHLFTPLGIREFHWKKTPAGDPDAEGGLYLRADDLARIGYLYLRDGMWNGKRILPEGWVAKATARHAKAVAPGWDYGYQWWVTSRDGVDIWAGRGFGGQFVVIIPARDVVFVVQSWNVFGDRVKSAFDAVLSAALLLR